MKKISKESKTSKKTEIVLKKGLTIVEKEAKGRVTFYENEMVTSLIYKKYHRKYQNLIKHLCFYLSTDDESGTALREALNEIEKFRIELKNKYQKILNKEELKKQEKELLEIEKEVVKKIYLMNKLFQNNKETSQNRSR